MFRSTIGWFSEKPKAYGPSIKGLIHKAVDFEQGVEFFKIGDGSGEVDVEGPVYCLKIGDTHIPIAQVAPDERIREIPTKDFTIESRRHDAMFGSSSTIPEVAVTLGHFGAHLPSIPHARGSVNYWQLWEGALHGYEFKSKQAMEQAFALVQEALPVLRFDHFPGWYDAKPVVCRHVRLRGVSDGIDASGEREAASVMLRAPAGFNPERGFSDELVAKFLFNAPTLEVLMAEVLDIERCNLFFGGWGGLSTRDERIWSILKRSYEAHYRDAYASFEHFLLNVLEILKSRSDARYAFWRYDVKLRY